MRRTVGAQLKATFKRRKRHAEDKRRDAIWTLATALTVFRALITSAGFVISIVLRLHWLLMLAFGLSMLLDFLDGLVARARRNETVIGAQLDGYADRLAALFVVVGTVVTHNGLATVIASSIVWLQYGIVDLLITNQFLRFGLWSPDHFYVIDEGVWRKNWSPEAKLASTASIAMLAVGSWYIWVGAALSLGLMAVRLSALPEVSRQAKRLIEEQHHAYEPPEPHAVRVAKGKATPRTYEYGPLST